jgi:putative methionine-R-sulfoxide reductase with GAF domain
MDKMMEHIGKAISSAAAQPWVLTALGVILVAFAVLLGALAVWKLKRDSEVTIAGLITIKPNELARTQREEIEKLTADSKQKSLIIKFFQQLSIEVSKAMTCRNEEACNELCEAVYQYALPGIGIMLTRQPANNHRVAIFVREGEGQLKIHQGVNFSPDGIKHLRLPLLDSAAGRVLRTGEPYFSGDVTAEGNSFTIHPKATKVYHSLICVPIKIGDAVLGVLSIDGEEKHSFTREDMEYLRYFAHALAPFLYLQTGAPLIRERLDPEDGIA